MRWLVAVLAGCGPAATLPPPPPKPVVSRAPACIDMTKFDDAYSAQAELGVAGDLVHVCYANVTDDQTTRECVGIDDTGKSVVVAQREPVVERSKVPRGSHQVRAGRPLACAPDGTCHPLGRRTAAAIAGAEHFEVTSDARAIAVGEVVWDVLKDHPLPLARPEEADAEDAFDRWSTFGRLVIGTWTPCAGPCTIHRVYTSDGKLVGDTFPSEAGPVMLDAKHFAIVDADDLVLHDLQTGVRLHEIHWGVRGESKAYEIGGKTYVWDTGGGPDAIPIIPLGNGRAAVMTRAEPTVTIIDYEKGRVEKRYRVALCDDQDAVEDADELD